MASATHDCGILTFEVNRMDSPLFSPGTARGKRRVVFASTLALLALTGVVGLGLPLERVEAQLKADSVQTPFGRAPLSFADIVDRVKPAVVSIHVTNGGPKVAQKGTAPRGKDLLPDLPDDHPLSEFFKRLPPEFRGQPGPNPGRPSLAQGSGFVISADGFVVTNNHVIDGANRIQVSFDKDNKFDAELIGTDQRTDVALLKIKASQNFPFVKFAEKLPRVGDWVVAVGNPFGLGGTVTAGIVSAQGRDIGAGPYDDFIQIDAPVNRGNSGGPTFDVDGKVIGVNTAIYSPSGGSVGIAFAIPAAPVNTVVAQLKDKGAVTRGWLGVQIQPVTADIADSLGLKKEEGALIAEPQADSPAAKAGIVAGDVITSVNGEAVKDARDFAKKIGAMAPGATAKLALLRKGETKTLSVTLGELPKEGQARASAEERDGAGSDAPRLGLTLAPAGKVAGAAGEGVVVTGVDPEGRAADHGFKTGDVILDVGGKAVATPAAVRNALADARADKKRTVLMRLKSGDATRFVAIPIAGA